MAERSRRPGAVLLTRGPMLELRLSQLKRWNTLPRWVVAEFEEHPGLLLSQSLYTAALSGEVNKATWIKVRQAEMRRSRDQPDTDQSSSYLAALAEALEIAARTCSPIALTSGAERRKVGAQIQDLARQLERAVLRVTPISPGGEPFALDFGPTVLLAELDALRHAAEVYAGTRTPHYRPSQRGAKRHAFSSALRDQFVARYGRPLDAVVTAFADWAFPGTLADSHACLK